MQSNMCIYFFLLDWESIVSVFWNKKLSMKLSILYQYYFINVGDIKIHAIDILSIKSIVMPYWSKTIY